MTDPMTPLERERLRLDEIDDRLLELLNARIETVHEIGRIKERLGLALYDPQREKAILSRLARKNPGPLDAEALARLFERIIDESRRLERSSMIRLAPHTRPENEP